MENSLPQGFTYITEKDSGIKVNLRYGKDSNALGSPVVGYECTNRAIMTTQAAISITSIQKKLQAEGYNLIIYDSYRPQRAVNRLKEWTENVNDNKNKK